jgi:hypothetical protein
LFTQHQIADMRCLLPLLLLLLPSVQAAFWVSC